MPFFGQYTKPGACCVWEIGTVGFVFWFMYILGESVVFAELKRVKSKG